MVILRPSLSRKTFGWSLLTIGALGLVLPFLQGFLFLAMGVFVLRDQHIWAARRWGWVAGRWPQQVTRIEEMEASLGRRLAGARERVWRLFSRP
ncbi:PGPGW domain-containing protein [Neoroseomonas lacus]|nr:PGPGW domain-containing protein [Neoroseomonas lacus]